MVCWEEAGGKVEGMEYFGPNVVSLLLMLGEHRSYVVGAYVPPNDFPKVHWVELALA